jgi:hypothetical protein
MLTKPGTSAIYLKSRSSVKASLFFRFVRGLGRFLHLLHVLDDFIHLGLETGGKIMRAVFEEHDETEGKKYEQDQPKKPAQQGHGVES